MKLIVPFAAAVFAASLPVLTSNTSALPSKQSAPKHKAQTPSKNRFSNPGRDYAISAPSLTPSMTVMPKCYIVDRYETLNGKSMIKDSSGHMVWSGVVQSSPVSMSKTPGSSSETAVAPEETDLNKSEVLVFH